MTSNILERIAFEQSRAAEYFSSRELVSQTGQDERFFANVVIKELIDNAVDAAEAAGINPKIDIRTEIIKENVARICVSDNGPGISAGIVKKILNFDTRTSDKQAYRSPTRGAQGNALKTIIGIPYAITGEKSQLTIISQGLKHCITVNIDPAGNPRVNHEVVDCGKTTGSVFSVDVPLVTDWRGRPYLDAESFINGYAMFNPHLTILSNGEEYHPSVELNNCWSKIIPTDPTSVFWYTQEDLTRLIYNYIASGNSKTLKNFVSEFRGLSGRKKVQEVARQFPGIKYLSDLEGNLNKISSLYAIMKVLSNPVSPKALGLVGEEHMMKNFERIAGGIDGYKYRSKNGMMDGIPFTVEVAFAETKGVCMQFTGINHSPTYKDPFSGYDILFRDGASRELGGGFNDIIDKLYDPCCVFEEKEYIAAVHLVCPRLDYKDRGKTSPVLSEEIIEALEQCIGFCLRDTYRQNKKTANEQERRRARQERLSIEAQREKERGKITKREAIFLEIPEAVCQATDEHKLPASYRSVFYKIRPLIQKYAIKTRRTKSGSYNVDLTLDNFRNIFKEYQQIYGPFDLIYAEPRGYMIEPHTGRRIDMGTREVSEYILPEKLYNKILYIEKLGLLPVFQAVNLAERYDVAIIGGQGYAVDAVKDLLARAEAETDIALCVLTDADPAGYEIRRTIAEETKYTPGHHVTVFDFGLTVEEALAWGLTDEKAHQKNRLSKALIERLTEVEAEYFLPQDCRDYSGNISSPWTLRRIELNAFGSRQLVDYVEAKFEELGIKAKVLPDDEIINNESEEQAHKELREIIQKELLKKFDIEKMASDIYEEVKDKLKTSPAENVRNELKDNPPDWWKDVAHAYGKEAAQELYDEAVVRLVKEAKP